MASRRRAGVVIAPACPAPWSRRVRRARARPRRARPAPAGACRRATASSARSVSSGSADHGGLGGRVLRGLEVVLQEVLDLVALQRPGRRRHQDLRGERVDAAGDRGLAGEDAVAVAVGQGDLEGPQLLLEQLVGAEPRVDDVARCCARRCAGRRRPLAWRFARGRTGAAGRVTSARALVRGELRGLHAGDVLGLVGRAALVADALGALGVGGLELVCGVDAAPAWPSPARTCAAPS